MAKGDHIYIQCLGYDHHGIDCGDGTVIHYSGSIKGGTKKIVRDSKSKFANGKSIKVKTYENKYSLDLIVQRAEFRLKNSYKEGYNLIFNNCEHFAYDCTQGKPDSPQVINGGSALALGMTVAGLAPVTATVSAGGILGLVGVTTTAVALAPTIALGGLVAGLGYLGLKALDNSD
ncbi:lecithin retinol acyltransferase family protein [Crocosphaera sp. UHCC 0190]|uniref:lecithin retinol acyltransferase family protein n=1 Tax=Crocosphaera sp. UHCC 0190 TaxID=3110246 RepID=UPI002B1F5358|nr:lecithin retinol acyltransferase family protein [Crocosphaera sp. UHCC 0190]MEA5510621.1 lecithin retinol acyltransferase family protein [Crocosphaera sp. UHCC 0190]